MAGFDERRSAERRHEPRGIVETGDPVLWRSYQGTLVAISDQVYKLQEDGRSLLALAEVSGLSPKGILNILKTESDVKVSTLVRLAQVCDCEIRVLWRRRRVDLEAEAGPKH